MNNNKIKRTLNIFTTLTMRFFQICPNNLCFFPVEERDRYDPKQSRRSPDDHVRVERQGPDQDGLAAVSLSRSGKTIENIFVFSLFTFLNW